MARRKDKTDDNRDQWTPQRREDAEIISEAKERYTRGMAYESYFRNNFLADIRFVNGDPDNHSQWPDEVYNMRTSDTERRPTMTVNVVAGNARMVINDTRMNLPSIAIKPTGDESTFESAQAYEALVRHIQYQSNATAIYIDAHQHQVWGGVGYFRIITKYAEENPEADESAFDQIIKIEPVRSHMGVLLDPDIKQKSGSDAMWGMVFDDISRDEYQRLHPNAGPAPAYNAIDQSDDWVREDTLRIGEYYRIAADPDEMIYFEQEGADGQPMSVTFRMSEAPDNIREAMRRAEKAGAQVKRRRIWNRRLEWYKIAGNRIIDRNLKLPGRGNYIPIVRVLGREVLVGGRMDRKGIIRPLKDAQRLLNYYVSTDAEFNALQPKSPFIGYKESFEGNEKVWNDLNTKNPPYLPVNMTSEEIEGPIPLPQRQQGPTDAPAYANGIQRAMQQIAIISGQNDANFGRTTNERSGLAIRERRRGGDNANYDLPDNLAEAVCHAGRIIVDWVPDVYDTARTIKVMGKDGIQSEIMIDPQQQMAIRQKTEGQVTRALFNPNVGRYEVQSDVGPSYATQREEAWDAFTGIVTQSPELMNIFGDLLFYTADFPLSDKIAERMVRHIQAQQPWLLGKGPTPQEQQITQQRDQLAQLNQQLLEELGRKEKKLQDQTADIAIKMRKSDTDAQRADNDTKRTEIDEQDAISRRITAVSNAQPELDRTGEAAAFDRLLADTLDLGRKTSKQAEGTNG